MGKKATGHHTPAQQAVIKEMIERAAELDKGRKLIDRANAIRDGLIPPPWLVKPATSNKPPKEGWQEKLIKPILRSRWPDGWADISTPDILKGVGNDYQKQHKRPVSRNTILRAAGRLPRR